ncbi:PASTA domain-containing protein [Sphingobacteriales bacterium UPWRP_1]|nr:hypothetical protein B6N25_03400 [Sphingobacteriales bacterium TSM_CSS]PSJ73156.1 PASTA domain-containing protein [Sphingobacteriales bacterium UPWRP_1]
MAAPVFRDIVEKYYSSKIKSHIAINQTPKEEMEQVKLPPAKNGYRTDLTAIFNQLAFNQQLSNDKSEWAVPDNETDTMMLKSMKVIDNLVPNVTGMGLRDAIYLLESQGLKVRFSGQGQVVDQSPLYGSRCKKGDVVSLNLD